MKMTGESFVEMNAADAQKAGLAEGDSVRLTSPFGSIKVTLKASDSLTTGYLFAPIHFSRPNLNALMSAVPMDPKARMPALKVVPVALDKLYLNPPPSAVDPDRFSRSGEKIP